MVTYCRLLICYFLMAKMICEMVWWRVQFRSSGERDMGAGCAKTCGLVRKVYLPLPDHTWRAGYPSLLYLLGTAYQVKAAQVLSRFTTRFSTIYGHNGDIAPYILTFHFHPVFTILAIANIAQLPNMNAPTKDCNPVQP